MTRKHFKKLLMSRGIPRNISEIICKCEGVYRKGRQSYEEAWSKQYRHFNWWGKDKN